MAQGLQGGAARAALTLGALVIAAGLAASCSSSTAPEPEAVEQQDSKLTSCGAPYAIHTTSDLATHLTVTPAANLFVPSTVQATGAMWYPNTVITAYVKFGTVTCDYQSAVPQALSVDLAFVACTGGVTPGTSVLMNSVEFWGTLSGGTAGLDVSLGRSLIDPIHPCVVNTCVNGAITPTNAPVGTTCDSSNLCTGIKTCDGSGGCTVAGAPPPTSDGDPCTADVACVPPSTLPTHTPIPGCGAPDGGAPPYPGNSSLASDFAGGAAFLYGPNGNQTGQMDAKRVAIVRGRVIDGSSVPPPVPDVPVLGAMVSILNHPEYGSSTTRSDGYYDLAVNGGDTFTVQIEKAGYPTVQRKIATRWLDFSVVPDVVMVPLDSPNTVSIDGTTKATIGWQTARGSLKTDSDGSRRATLLIPPGTKVANWTPSGSTLTFRATEFTVGTNGPAAMPGDLPSTSAYTYALDLSIDEATQPTTTFTNADPTFANSVIFYVEHFVGPGLNTLTPSFPVPSGYYDRAAGIWKAEATGRIVRILSANGTAVLSLDGTTAMSAQDMTDLGITTAELQQLATAPLYAGATNKDLWRVRMPHFTAYDCNWNAGLESTARPPPEAAPRADTPEPNSCLTEGSIIECENQVLGESLPIAGTPFSLSYRSETQNGYHPTITVPISDETAASIPASFDHGEVEIVVAGKRALLTFAKPAVNQRLEWSWDRTDAYGRAVQGTATAHVKVSYAYRAVTSNYTADFGKFGTAYSFGLTRGARTITLSKSFDVSVGGLDAKPLGLGGWTLSAKHVLEPGTGTAWLGTGGKRSLRDQGDRITTRYLDSNGYRNNDVAVAGDGTVYVSHQFQTSEGVFVARLSGAGAAAISLPGMINYVSFTDGAPLSGIFVDPRAIVVGADDFLYVAETHRVLRVNRATLQTYLVAGSRQSAPFGPSGTSPDGSVAAGAPLNTLSSVAVGADGLVYFAEAVPGGLVRRVRTNGTLETVAGTGANTGVSAGCETSDLCRADQQAFHAISAIASDPKGGIYFYPQGEYRVWRMDGDNTIHLVAGNGSLAPSYEYPNGDGGSARAAPLGPITGLSFSRGSLYLAGGDLRIRRVGADGWITRAAGNGTTTLADGSVATGSGMSAASRVVLGPDGYFLVADGTRIRRFGTAGDPVVNNNTLVMSPGGDEVYAFDATGRHVTTSSAFRGATHYTFNPDGQGRLGSITDWFAGNATALGLVYSSGGVTLTSQFGRVTTLTFDSNGYLASITNPNAEVVNVTHSATGLLRSLTDALGKVHTFSYTPSGLLVRDKNALANTSGVSLSRNSTDRAFSVLVTSPEGRGTLHTVDMTRASSDPLRVELRTHVSPVGVTSTEARRSDGSRLVTYPQLAGQTNTIADTLSPDPRFSFGSTYLSNRVATAGATGSPKTATVTTARTTTPAVMTDPFTLTQQIDTTSFSATSGDIPGPVGVQYDKLTTTSTRTVTMPSGLQVIETLDDKDRVTQIARPGNLPCIAPCTPVALVPVVVGYDLNRLATMTQAGSTATHTSSITYDPTSGFVTQVATPLGGTIAYGDHDAMGRPKSIFLPPGNVNTSRKVSLLYDLNGNPQKVTMPLVGGRDHFFTPNSLDLLGTYAPPSSSPGGSTSYTYDADSLLMSLLAPQATVTHLRDFAGRVTNVTYPTSIGSTESVTTHYDAAGHVGDLVSALGGTLTYGYNGDMVTSEATTNVTGFAHTVNKTYDNFQRVTDRNLDGQASIHFARNTDGLVSALSGAPWGTYSIARTSGMISGTTLGSLTDAYEYDEFGALKRYQVKYGSAVKYDVSYLRDPSSGRVNSMTELIEGQGTCTVSYGYDPAGTGFLASSSGCSTGTSNAYDADGNTPSPGGTFDAQDRLGYDGWWSYTYDADGNVASQTTPWYDTYGFNTDPVGNLRRMSTPYGTNYDFVVDGRNRRIVDLQNGALLQGYIWDGNRIVGYHKPSNGLTAHWAYGTKAHVPDLMVQWDTGTNSWKAYRIISDQLGSVKMVIDAASGTVIEWRRYDAWGVPAATGGSQAAFSTVPFGFAGGLWNGNVGLYRFGARDYNPWRGRWWSKDASRFGGGWNFYQYANNDPVNFFDPTGYDVEVCSRVADLPVARDIGLPHKWLRTGSKEAGLGALGQGVPGAHPDSPYVTQTSINDHTGEGEGAGATCQVVKDVDEDCVNKALAIGCPMGPWSGYNQCWTMVYDILDRCSTKPPPPRLPAWVYRALGVWGFLL